RDRAKRGFGAAETAQEKTDKTVPVPTRKSVSADCPALDALRLLPPQRSSVPHARKLSSGKGTVLSVFSLRLRLLWRASFGAVPAASETREIIYGTIQFGLFNPLS
ncbi:MAG TPA: hypothetical protein VMV69_04855, partial [Pirellulales bacterium]|nr:hypothetical protein [Pirellulales bacterium]